MLNIKQNTQPVLFERLISDLNIVLAANLDWLDNAFGRAYSIVSKRENQNYIEPAIYIDNSEYMSVLPDQGNGNFSFIMLNDPQKYDGIQSAKGILTANGFIVFWVDLSTIYTGDYLLQAASENTKLEIVRILTTPGLLPSGRVKLIDIEEKAENVYKGFSLKQVENQHLIYPFCGFRFNCEFKINELCFTGSLPIGRAVIGDSFVIH